MPHPDQGPSFADDVSADPESVYRVYLTTDVRPAIRAATADQMRGILAAIARHLCHHLTDPIGGIPPLSPDSRAPWQVCQAGTGTRVGLQLYSRVLQAVAGSYLQARSCATPASNSSVAPCSTSPTTWKRSFMTATLPLMPAHKPTSPKTSGKSQQASAPRSSCTATASASWRCTFCSTYGTDSA